MTHPLFALLRNVHRHDVYDVQTADNWGGQVWMHESDVLAALSAAPNEGVRASAAVVLKWIDDMADPTALALAIANADEALVKAHDRSGSLEAAKHAFARRFVESIAMGNAEPPRKLTGEANN